MGVAFLCAALFVVDGDTIRCGSEHIRLLGIDAPEIHGCRQGRICAPGDGNAAKRSLASSVNGSVTVEPVTQDRYGRTVAVVYSGGANLSCAQLAAGMAVYVAKWDNGRRVQRDCPMRRRREAATMNHKHQVSPFK